MTLSQATDAELLADSANPAESFATFYRRHADAILRFAASRGADAETAADVVAETFYAAMQRRHRYRPKHESARLWLLGIAVHKIADARRADQRERRRMLRAAEHALVMTERDRASYAEMAERTDALDALADLPEAEREVILARVVEDRSYADIAAALGLTEAATRKRVSRGLARLRTRLERSW
ncbi:MAG TPA: sigma-70 family RNA polymerase sigma factor [Baekduia sp.]|nr:sigma-70 family RNA polymerase sigma factor [Baekduia sp.]